MFIDHRQEQWPEWLGTAEFAYNNKVHAGTKVLPFKANSGQEPRMGFEMRKKGKHEGAEKFAERMCHKLHSAITPRILARFTRSKMRRKALKKTFRTMPKTCQSNQYSSRYQLISAGH